MSIGVLALLLWPTIVLEVGGGIALAIGFQVRSIAPALAIFSIIAASIFHHRLSAPVQLLKFLKDFAVADGLALAPGPGINTRPQHEGCR